MPSASCTQSYAERREVGDRSEKEGEGEGERDREREGGRGGVEVWVYDLVREYW
jgi:hypothetical protein